MWIAALALVAQLVTPIYSNLTAAGGSCSDLTSSMEGVWRLEEASGASRTDSSGNGNTLSLSGTVTQDTTHFVEGSASAEYGGTTGNWLNIADASLAAGFPGKSGTTNGTVSFGAHLRAHSTAANSRVISKRDAYELLLISASLCCRVATSGSVDACSNSTISTDTWYHASCTYDGSTVTLRLDKTDQTDTEAATGNVATSGNALGVGGRAGSGDFAWDGEIDEAWVYAGDLTNAEQDCIADDGVDGGGLP